MKKKESSAKKIDLKDYQREGDLSIKQMNIGLWLSVNRKRILRIIIIFLIISSASLFSYSSYHYIIYFLYGRQADRDLVMALTESIFDVNSYRENNMVKPLLSGPVNSFSLNGKTDFLVTLKNSNEKFFANFDYCIKDDTGQDLACDQGFILPDSEKYLVMTAQEIEKAPTNLSLQFVNINWQRLNNREIPNWSNYLAERLNLDITDLVYLKPDFNARTPLHTVSFTIKNSSAYHYNRIPLDILLFNGSSLTGLNVYNISDLMSLESRSLKITWPAGTERATKVEIVPDINIIDSDVFLPYRG